MKIKEVNLENFPNFRFLRITFKTRKRKHRTYKFILTRVEDKSYKCASSCPLYERCNPGFLEYYICDRIIHQALCEGYVTLSHPEYYYPV